MRKRYSEKQIAQALRLSEQGVATGQICRQLGISDATFYAWNLTGSMPGWVCRNCAG